MSERHPIIAITGSSGAGTTSVTRTFENIFRREVVRAAVIDGDSFHRFDRKEMKLRQAEVRPITETITFRATELMETMTLSHGLQMGDALIAATALEHGIPLLTGNVRHFAAIPALRIEGFVA